MKMVEQVELDLFLEAYREVTGERLEFVDDVRERPDFLCRRESGEVVRVELTKVMRTPSSTTRWTQPSRTTSAVTRNA
jgi:hypothetical protein